MNLVRAYDLETFKGHYINVIENTPEIEKYARWVYGKLNRYAGRRGKAALVRKLAGGEKYDVQAQGEGWVNDSRLDVIIGSSDQ